jgi:hypothetical protein
LVDSAGVQTIFMRIPYILEIFKAIFCYCIQQTLIIDSNSPVTG